MKITGKCYCGALCYEANGEPGFKGQCHCRECQYFSGGAPNVMMAMDAGGFSYTKGKPKIFRRKDLPSPMTREFCAECGTHTVTRVPNMDAMVFIKAGTLDDPSIYGMPQMAIFTSEKQSFHCIPEGVQQVEKAPGG